MAQPQKQNNGKKIILLVEDDIDVRDVTRFILSQMGFEVIEATSGSEALNFLESDSPIDLLLTDVGLPGGMNGVELVQEAVQCRPDLPVLIISAYDDDSLKQFGATRLNATVLRKPYLQEELEEEIAKMIQGKS